MSGLLNDAIAWLPTVLASAKTIAGGVTLSRGVLTTASVPAIRSWHTNRLTDSDGLATDVRPYDYLIAVTAYQLGGEQTDPQPGDRITESLGVFEVLPAAGEPCFVLREDGLLRLHTKRVE